jgi:hypothetical protein
MDLVGQICDSIEREKFRFLCRFNFMFVRAIESSLLPGLSTAHVKIGRKGVVVAIVVDVELMVLLDFVVVVDGMPVVLVPAVVVVVGAVVETVDDSAVVVLFELAVVVLVVGLAVVEAIRLGQVLLAINLVGVFWKLQISSRASCFGRGNELEV